MIRKGQETANEVADGRMEGKHTMSTLGAMTAQ